MFNSSLFAISDISVSNALLTPLFDSNTKVYNVYVESEREIVTISVSKSENEIVKGVGSKNLMMGLNTFKVKSYINDILVKEYTINIVRGEEKLDSNLSSLTNLYISSYDIDFDSEIFDYYVDEYKTDCKIYYEVNNPLSKVSIKEEENKYIIKVVSENKMNSSVYTINFKNDQKKENHISNNNYIKYIIVASFILVVVSSFIILFYKHKRK